jgi:hypothetical protein
LTRARRSIALVNVEPKLRRVLLECRDPACRKCKDGFEAFRGQRAIICGCSFGLFVKVLEFRAQEAERRAAGLPVRMMRIEDRELRVADVEEAEDAPATPLRLTETFA